jgi:hypothetical protein
LGFAVGFILSDFDPGVTMRFAMLGVAAATVLMTTVPPARACFEAVQAFYLRQTAGELTALAQAASTDLSAKTRHHKKAKPKEKVEYMRAAPWK